jgi:hypothetical protein
MTDADRWIRAHVEPTGEIEVVHERPWGVVRHVPTSRGDVWFKACSAVQAFEPALTATLAARHPERLPAVLAHEDERAWLLLEDAGAPLGFDVGVEPWLPILPLYAELQLEEAKHVAGLLDLGVPDRRLAAFPELYDGRRKPQFVELCAELDARGIPDSIQHDDLHGANVYGSRILDWGDSCISHPFLTMYVAFVHIEPRIGDWYERARDAYLEPWGSSAELRETFDLAYRLGPFAHLFKELRVNAAIPEEQRAVFAPDLPRLEADCLAAMS